MYILKRIIGPGIKVILCSHAAKAALGVIMSLF